MQSELQLVLCTVPDRETADAIARELVSDRLAACVNVLSNISSVYRWEGKVETASELLLLIKSAASCRQALQQKIASMHPYELPEIIAVSLEGGLQGYLDWVADSLDNSQ